MGVNEKLSDTVDVKTGGEPGAPMVLNTRPLFKLMVERKASDLFFTSNAPIKVKIEGQILPINKQILSPEAVRQKRYRFRSRHLWIARKHFQKPTRRARQLRYC